MAARPPINLFGDESSPDESEMLSLGDEFDEFDTFNRPDRPVAMPDHTSHDGRGRSIKSPLANARRVLVVDDIEEYDDDDNVFDDVEDEDDENDGDVRAVVTSHAKSHAREKSATSRPNPDAHASLVSTDDTAIDVLIAKFKNSLVNRRRTLVKYLEGRRLPPKSADELKSLYTVPWADRVTVRKIVDDVWGRRSSFTGDKIGSLGDARLVKLDPSKPCTVENVVVGTSKESQYYNCLIQRAGEEAPFDVGTLRVMSDRARTIRDARRQGEPWKPLNKLVKWTPSDKQSADPTAPKKSAQGDGSRASDNKDGTPAKTSTKTWTKKNDTVPPKKKKKKPRYKTVVVNGQKCEYGREGEVMGPYDDVISDEDRSSEDHPEQADKAGNYRGLVVPDAFVEYDTGVESPGEVPRRCRRRGHGEAATSDHDVSDDGRDKRPLKRMRRGERSVDDEPGTFTRDLRRNFEHTLDRAIGDAFDDMFCFSRRAAIRMSPQDVATGKTSTARALREAMTIVGVIHSSRDKK